MRDDIAAIHEHAGMGGTSHGFRSIGVPTAMGVDAWDAVNAVRRPNEERTMSVWLGTEQGQAHPDDQERFRPQTTDAGYREEPSRLLWLAQCAMN